MNTGGRRELSASGSSDCWSALSRCGSWCVGRPGCHGRANSHERIRFPSLLCLAVIATQVLLRSFRWRVAAAAPRTEGVIAADADRAGAARRLPRQRGPAGSARRADPGLPGRPARRRRRRRSFRLGRARADRGHGHPGGRRVRRRRRRRRARTGSSGPPRVVAVVGCVGTALLACRGRSGTARAVRPAARRSRTPVAARARADPGAPRRLRQRHRPAQPVRGHRRRRHRQRGLLDAGRDDVLAGGRAPSASR